MALAHQLWLRAAQCLIQQFQIFSHSVKEQLLNREVVEGYLYQEEPFWQMLVNI